MNRPRAHRATGARRVTQPLDEDDDVGAGILDRALAAISNWLKTKGRK